MDTKPLLNLTTAAEEVFTFLIDGNEYRLRTVGTLNRDEEAKFRVLIARESRHERQLEKCKPHETEKITRHSNNLRDVRVELICLLTDVPKDVVDQLNLVQHNQILSYIGKDAKAIQRELSRREDEDEDEDEDDFEAGDDESVEQEDVAADDGSEPEMD